MATANNCFRQKRTLTPAAWPGAGLQLYVFGRESGRPKSHDAWLKRMLSPLSVSGNYGDVDFYLEETGELWSTGAVP